MEGIILIIIFVVIVSIIGSCLDIEFEGAMLIVIGIIAFLYGAVKLSVHINEQDEKQKKEVETLQKKRNDDLKRELTQLQSKKTKLENEINTLKNNEIGLLRKYDETTLNDNYSAGHSCCTMNNKEEILKICTACGNACQMRNEDDLCPICDGVMNDLGEK